MICSWLTKILYGIIPYFFVNHLLYNAIVTRIIFYLNLSIAVITVISLALTLMRSITDEKSIIESELIYISQKINTILTEEKEGEIEKILINSILSNSGYYLEYHEKGRSDIVINPESQSYHPESSLKNYSNQLLDINVLKSYRINNNAKIFVKGNLISIAISRFLNDVNNIPHLIAIWYLFFSIYTILFYKGVKKYLHDSKNKIINSNDIKTPKGYSELNVFDEIKEYTKSKNNKHRMHLNNEKQLHKNEVISLTHKNDETKEKLDHIINETSSIAMAQSKLINNLRLKSKRLKEITTDKDSTLEIIQIEQMLSTLVQNNNNLIYAQYIIRNKFDPRPQDFYYLNNECCDSVNTIAEFNLIDITYTEQLGIPTELNVNSSIFKEALLEIVERQASIPSTDKINVLVSYIDTEDSHLLIEVSTTFNKMFLTTTNKSYLSIFEDLQKRLQSIGGSLKYKIMTETLQNAIAVEIPAISTGNQSSLYKSTLYKLSDKTLDILIIDFDPIITFMLTSKLGNFNFKYKTAKSIELILSKPEQFDVIFIPDASNNRGFVSSLKAKTKLVVGVENTYSHNELRKIQSLTGIDIALPKNIHNDWLANCLMNCSEYCNNTFKNQRVFTDFVTTENLFSKLTMKNKNTHDHKAKGNIVHTKTSTYPITTQKQKRAVIYSCEATDLEQMSQILTKSDIPYSSTINYNDFHSMVLSGNVDYVIIFLHNPEKECMESIKKLNHALNNQKVAFHMASSNLSRIYDIEFLNIFKSILIYPINEDNIQHSIFH